ncbi:OmpA family protein [Vicingaceae bacterium]|nr:OmpA family protein [Vicingaceae bacterium]
MMSKKIIIPILMAAFFVGCVPAKKHEELMQRRTACEEQSTILKEQVRELEEQITEIQSKFDDYERRLKGLQGDTTVQGKSLRTLTKNYDKLNETYDLLLEKNRELLAGNAADNKRLFGNLQDAEGKLQEQKDALDRLSLSLKEKEKNLEKLTFDLEDREAKVAELQKILSDKDSIVNALRMKVQDALLGFENEGLTIEKRNGKVYVSLDESLLYKSGSYSIDPKGQEVLKKLAVVLEQNTDINILVEGHTDNVPLKSSGPISDNWDLSVRRATAVVKIITENSKVNPSRLTAAGRGEHVPIASNNTKEGRTQNRRTEIILTPKLDELFEILGE